MRDSCRQVPHLSPPNLFVIFVSDAKETLQKSAFSARLVSQSEQCMRRQGFSLLGDLVRSLTVARTRVYLGAAHRDVAWMNDNGNAA
jgi:hypothetical protein